MPVVHTLAVLKSEFLKGGGAHKIRLETEMFSKTELEKGFDSSEEYLYMYFAPYGNEDLMIYYFREKGKIEDLQNYDVLALFDNVYVVSHKNPSTKNVMKEMFRSEQLSKEFKKRFRKQISEADYKELEIFIREQVDGELKKNPSLFKDGHLYIVLLAKDGKHVFLTIETKEDPSKLTRLPYRENQNETKDVEAYLGATVKSSFQGLSFQIYVFLKEEK